MAPLRKTGRRAVAYHEAGHAVMRLELSRRLSRVTIRPRGDILGHTKQRRSELDVDYFDPRDWRLTRWAQTEIMCALAGPEAERRLTGRRNNSGARSDDECVLDVALQAEGYGDERRNAYVTWLKLKVRDWVAAPPVWAQIEALAKALLERDTLSGDEVRQVCRTPFSSTASVLT